MEVWHLDLASLKSVKGFAEKYLDSGLPLHLLINNGKFYNFIIVISLLKEIHKTKPPRLNDCIQVHLFLLFKIIF